MIKRKLSRKQAAPRNLAAKALAQRRFQPKVETASGSYSRKLKHKPGAGEGLMRYFPLEEEGGAPD